MVLFAVVRRVESLTPPPLAFVIGGTGENPSLTGPFFSAGQSYSSKGLCSSKKKPVFPSFHRQPLDPSLPRAQEAGQWSRGPKLIPPTSLPLRKTCFFPLVHLPSVSSSPSREKGCVTGSLSPASKYHHFIGCTLFP